MTNTNTTQQRCAIPADQFAEMRNLLARNLDALAEVPAVAPRHSLTPEYREAHEAIDYVLCNMRGVIWSLGSVAQECDGLKGPDDEAQAIWSLINVLEGEVNKAIKLMAKQWVASGGVA